MHLFYPISLYYLHVEPRLGLSAPKKAQREVPCAVCVRRHRGARGIAGTPLPPTQRGGGSPATLARNSSPT